MLGELNFQVLLRYIEISVLGVVGTLLSYSTDFYTRTMGHVSYLVLGLKIGFERMKFEETRIMKNEMERLQTKVEKLEREL